MKALIVGGGIGGLAAAVALHREGIEPVVLERATRIEEVGAGLSLWSNAMVALRCLGLEARVFQAGSVLTRAVTLAASGKQIDSVDIAELSRKAGADSVCAHRADLQWALADALPPGVIRTGSACQSFLIEADQVVARLNGGKEVRGDILIGADGIHSAIRKQLLGDSAPRYAGYVALRGIAQSSRWLAPGEHRFVQGRGSQIGVLPCGRDRTYWFATRNAKAKTTWTKAQLLDWLRGWPDVARAVVEATAESAILQNDVIDRPPSRQWGRGRVTLLGDAIHPTTPNLGQGACQALEDAVALAECLRGEASVEDRLRAYEFSRMRRTAMVTERSWRLGQILQWQNPAAVWLRDALTRTGPGRRTGVKLMEEMLSSRVAGTAK
jgi:2-polyprenyl-6-methoxyphenol hydroxylase-like FAD-dependent oxidoreductase